MAITGYTKLFSTIVTSTIWRCSNETRIVWITMLALADRHGVVEASLPGLADISRVTLAQCEVALAELAAPDHHSRSRNDEGRRIVEIEGGWRLLNHEKYRRKMAVDEKRARNTAYMQGYRARKASSQTHVSQVRQVEQAEAYSGDHEQRVTGARSDSQEVSRLARLAVRERAPDSAYDGLLDAAVSAVSDET